MRTHRAAVICFAVGLLGLGVLALVYGDFAEEWQTIPASFPGRTGLAYASGVVMVLGGVGLLFERTIALSVRMLFPFLVVGFLLQLPALVVAPLVEVNWEQGGELAVLLCGGWVLFATLGESRRFAFATGANGFRMARILFGLWLLPIGVSHFAYLTITVGLVPSWLPFRTGWAYLTGAGHIAAGLGVLFSVLPRLAATMETGMLAGFTVLVWIPKIVATPTDHGVWSEFIVSWTITAAAWLVAESIPWERTRESRSPQPVIAA
jgi:uncharacterized membrane protein